MTGKKRLSLNGGSHDFTIITKNLINDQIINLLNRDYTAILRTKIVKSRQTLNVIVATYINKHQNIFDGKSKLTFFKLRTKSYNSN